MFKDKLREARDTKNITQDYMAENINVASNTYAKWEKGETEPKHGQIDRICKILNIEPNDLFDVNKDTNSVTASNLKKVEMLSRSEQLCINQIIEAMLLKHRIEEVKQDSKNIMEQINTQGRESLSIEDLKKFNDENEIIQAIIYPLILVGFKAYYLVFRTKNMTEYLVNRPNTDTQDVFDTIDEAIDRAKTIGVEVITLSTNEEES